MKALREEMSDAMRTLLLRKEHLQELRRTRKEYMSAHQRLTVKNHSRAKTLLSMEIGNLNEKIPKTEEWVDRFKRDYRLEEYAISKAEGQAVAKVNQKLARG